MKAVGVVGLDLSTRGTAAVYLPPGWRPGDWDVANIHIGYEAKKDDHARHTERIHDIASTVVRFIGKHGTPVFVEEYAFSKGGGYAATMVRELGGTVKAYIFRDLGLVAQPVGQSVIRRYFLNGIPVPQGKGGMARALASAFAPLGCPWEDSDRRDALLVASWGRTEFGLPGLLARG